MQESRRAFAKKAAIITAAAVATTGTVVLAGNGETSVQDDSNNGVVVGKSIKKRFYTKKQWLGKSFIKTQNKFSRRSLCQQIHMKL